MPSSIYMTAEGAARMGALCDEALAALGVDYERRWIPTRSGDTHVLVVGPSMRRPQYPYREQLPKPYLLELDSAAGA